MAADAAAAGKAPAAATAAAASRPVMRGEDMLLAAAAVFRNARPRAGGWDGPGGEAAPIGEAKGDRATVTAAMDACAVRPPRLL